MAEVPLSAEAQQMQDDERIRWLTVGEAQRMRESWRKFSGALDKQAGKLDANPEDGKEALVFATVLALMASSFSAQMGEHAIRLADLHEGRRGTSASGGAS